MIAHIIAILRTTGQVVLALPSIIKAIKTIIDTYHASKAKRRKEALEEIKNAKTDEERKSALNKLHANL